MTIDKLLDKFDKDVSNIVYKLSKNVETEFRNSSNQITFTLNDGLSDIKKEVNKLPNTPGLYYFEIDFAEFYKKLMGKEEWQEEDVTEYRAEKSYFYEEVLDPIWNGTAGGLRGTGTYPKIIKKRFDYHFRKNPPRNSFKSGWVPFYLGKHEKSIKNRVRQHITESGMRLFNFIDAEYYIFCKLPIRVSVAEIPNMTDKRKFLVAEVEKNLREKLHPIIGKQ